MRIGTALWHRRHDGEKVTSLIEVVSDRDRDRDRPADTVHCDCRTSRLPPCQLFSLSPMPLVPFSRRVGRMGMKNLGSTEMPSSCEGKERVGRDYCIRLGLL
jgi:hypothetical protein